MIYSVIHFLFSKEIGRKSERKPNVSWKCVGKAHSLFITRLGQRYRNNRYKKVKSVFFIVFDKKKTNIELCGYMVTL